MKTSAKVLKLSIMEKEKVRRAVIEILKTLVQGNLAQSGLDYSKLVVMIDISFKRQCDRLRCTFIKNF